MLVKTPTNKEKTKPNRRKQKKKKKARRSTKPPNDGNGRRTNKKSKKPLLNIAPWKIILGVILLGGVGFLYLHHVFTTKKLLDKVEAMEQEYNQAKRSYKKTKMKYERMTGPVNITQKARKMGLVNGGPAKEIIKVKPE